MSSLSPLLGSSPYLQDVSSAEDESSEVEAASWDESELSNSSEAAKIDSSNAAYEAARKLYESAMGHEDNRLQVLYHAAELFAQTEKVEAPLERRVKIALDFSKCLLQISELEDTPEKKRQSIVKAQNLLLFIHGQVSAEVSELNRQRLSVSPRELDQGNLTKV